MVHLQALGIALAIIGGLVFVICVYALTVYKISQIRSARREKVLAAKFFNNIEEYRRDFDHNR